jgi:hypothetical protein
MGHLLAFRAGLRLFPREGQDLLMRRDVSADAAEELYGAGTIERESHIFE